MDDPKMGNEAWGITRTIPKTTGDDMEYTIAMLERIRARLAALPKPDVRNRKLNKQASVGFLANDLTASLRKGHTIEEIAAVLTAEGIDLSPLALKTYIQRSRAGKKKGRGGSHGSSEGREPAVHDRPLPSDHSTGVKQDGAPVARGPIGGRDPATAATPARSSAAPKGSALSGKDKDGL